MVGTGVSSAEKIQPPNTLLLQLWPMVNLTQWVLPDGGLFAVTLIGLHQIKDPVYGDQCNMTANKVALMALMLMVQLEGSFIDEKLVEHNRTQNWEVWPDEDLEKWWSGEFAMLFEYGLYKKFESSKPSYRPVGCPGLPDKWEDMPYSGHDMNWTKIERCPLNDYAPEGKPLYQIVEDTADDHDVFGQNLLAAFERMIQNGYDPILDLQDAPTNSWFGYYTMENQDRFSDALDENFEDFVVENAPLTFTDPNADPYVCALAAVSYYKCRFTFSQVAEIAKLQYSYPLQFTP